VKIEEYLKKLQEKSNRLAGKRELLMKILQSSEENEQAQMLLTLNNEVTNLSSQHQSIINQLNEVNLQLAQTKNRLENEMLASRDNTKKSLNKLNIEYDANKKRIEENRSMLTESQLKYDSLKSKEEEFRQASANMQKTLSEYDMRINGRTAQFNSLNELISKSTLRTSQITTRIDNLREKLQTEYNTLRMYGDGTLVEYEEGCEAGLALLDQEASELKSVLNYLAEKDYQNVFESYKNMSLRSNQLEEEKNSIIEMIDQIDNRKRGVFMDSFEKIDRNLRAVFTELTKGNAWLEIEKPDDIFSGGVFLMVQFPEKKPKESLMLSGGEKTITTVAFVLAMQSAFKSPFYLFDEIDAHLDALNLEKLIDILRKRATESQIILITLKDVTLTKADKILGVYQRGGYANLVEYSPEMKVKEVQS
jgi:chromosome segregation protein